MCEKTWGEEFRDALALASGSSALDECAALNVSRVVELAQQCLPHCPPIDGHKAQGGSLSVPTVLRAYDTGIRERFSQTSQSHGLLPIA